MYGTSLCACIILPFLLSSVSSRGLVSGGLITTSTPGLGHLKVCLPTTPVPVAALCLPTTPVPVAALGVLSPRPPPPPILHRLVAHPPASSPPSSNLVKLGQFPRLFSSVLRIRIHVFLGLLDPDL